MTSSEPLLRVENLSLSYHADGIEQRGLRDISFTLRSAAVLGIVGESGSGKSTLSFAVTRLLPKNAGITAGHIFFCGQDLAHANPTRLRSLRGERIAMIFQDPLASLHPCLSIGRQMEDALKAHRRMGKRERRQTAADMLTLVGIPDAVARLDQYPHEFSGGMRQRIMIAMAVMMQPDLLIADEPTSALDVTLQEQIIALLLSLRDRLGTAMLIVSHDLGVIAGAAEEVMVMYAGEAIEHADTRSIFSDPLHPYTQALLSVVPGAKARGNPLPTIPGRVPGASEIITGCAFAGRCMQARTVCIASRPSFRAVGERHVRCHIYDDASGWHAAAPLPHAKGAPS